MLNIVLKKNENTENNIKLLESLTKKGAQVDDYPQFINIWFDDVRGSVGVVAKKMACFNWEKTIYIKFEDLICILGL